MTIDERATVADLASTIQHILKDVLEPAAAALGLEISYPRLGPISRVGNKTEAAMTALAEAGDGQWPLSEQLEPYLADFCSYGFSGRCCTPTGRIDCVVLASGWDEQAATELTSRFYTEAALSRSMRRRRDNQHDADCRYVNDIPANPAPVLFLDTCILLDIVRAPLRNKPSEIQFARLFLTAVQKTPKTIHLLVASPTQREWTDHIAETENDCTIAVNGCNAVASICGHMGLPPVAFLPAGVLTCQLSFGICPPISLPQLLAWITTPLPWDELSIVSSLQLTRQSRAARGPRTRLSSNMPWKRPRNSEMLGLREHAFSSARTPGILQMQVPPTCMATHPGIQRRESGVRGQSDACREHSDGGRLGAVNLNEQRYETDEDNRRTGGVRSTITNLPILCKLLILPFKSSLRIRCVSNPTKTQDGKSGSTE